MPRITVRSYPPEAAAQLVAAGLHPVLARVFAARGITQREQLEYSLGQMLPPALLTNSAEMARLLADAIGSNKRILIVADYDSDGATACAVAMRGLRVFGASVDFLVPNRFEYGYGLTPEIVRLAATMRPDIIITVDNGIASVEGVEEAQHLGIEVLVTDHHLSGEQLPRAACIVNPNQHGCGFPSKNLAGVGVMFYVLMALRAEMRRRGCFVDGKEPELGPLLDLVALGTVADVVRLDDNNRILVEQGLRKIRAGKGCAGINALLKIAGRDPTRASASDLGFAVAPRLNAAGRLEDMSVGIACLLADSPQDAMLMAQRLDGLNRERQSIEVNMHDVALAALDEVDVGDRFSLSLFDRRWHQGVVGILASRLKDRYHRPVIAFAPAGNGELRGSGRSIPGLHLRDALDMVGKRHDTLLRRFGGHAMAAGLTIAETDFELFSTLFEQVVQESLALADMEAIVETDGMLATADITLELADMLDRQVWGQGFAAPVFHGQFAVVSQRGVGGRHLQLGLQMEGKPMEAILFNHAQNVADMESLPPQIQAAYQLQANHFNGATKLRLTLRHWEPCQLDAPTGAP